MKLGRRDLGIGVAASFAASSARAAPREAANLGEAARVAALGLIPYYEMYATRWADTVDETNPQRMRLNRLIHEPRAGTSQSVAGAVPDADTLTSRAWLALELDPMFLTPPDMGARFYSFASLDMSGRTFAQISSRLSGSTPPPQAIVGPRWKGSIANDVVAVRAPGNVVLLQGQIEIGPAGDVATARSWQRRTLLETPEMRNERRILEVRELMRSAVKLPQEPVAEWVAPEPANPFDLFEVGARVLPEAPLAESDAELLAALHDLRLRPGRRYDWRAFDRDDREIMLEGIERAWTEVHEAVERFATASNGWQWLHPPTDAGASDRLYRATRSAVTLADSEPEEMIVAMCSNDSAGRPLRGDASYLIRIEADMAPVAKGFWSLAALVRTADGTLKVPAGEAPAKLRDRTLRKSSDGAVEIRLQPDPPAGAATSNWLRSGSGAICLAWRIHQPSEDLLAGRLRLPAVERA